MNPQINPLDTKRFGIVCARLNNWDNPEGALAWCKTNNVDLLITRIDVADVEKSWDLQSRGAKMVDALNYYELNLSDGGTLRQPLDAMAHVRAVTQADEQALKDIGTRAFADYFSHYHNDPLLDDCYCNDAYGDWASSFARSEDGKIGIALIGDGAIVGFAGLRYLSEDKLVDGELFAVAPEARGNRGFSHLLDAAIAKTHDLGADTFRYSTQIQNKPVMNALHRRGMLISKSIYTFHLWLDQ